MRASDFAASAWRRRDLDGSGRPSATVTRTVGGTTTQERCYVVDLRDSVDDRLRATALVVGLLWDGYTIAWQAGG